MIRQKMLFIIGAGGSCPYGFSDSGSLRKKIISQFSGYILELYKEHLERNNGIDIAGKLNDKTKQVNIFCDKFYESDASIDLFITRHKNNKEWVDLGKQAIALFIHNEEIGSTFSEKIIDDSKRIQNWYSILFDRMTKNIKSPETVGEFSYNKVKFITFNYDRSLEYFLHSRLMANFGQSKGTKNTIIEVLNDLQIYHVYGSLGKLEWQKLDMLNLGYREKITYSKLIKISENIQIMHGSRGESPLLEKIKDIISDHNLLVFLGFAFAEENVDILNFKECIHAFSIYATCYGMTDSEVSYRKKLFLQTSTPLGSYKFENDYHCAMLLRNYYNEIFW